ncbi:hypothetical protein NCC49_003380 [Naganishia albida]|nr:hypothetical protein NCC49_003380 [Naganishia albida]
MPPQEGAVALEACVNRNLGECLQVTVSRANLVEWRKILRRSTQALHDLRSERKSMLLPDRAAPMRMMQIYATIHVGDTAKALGLLSRLLADSSTDTILRLLLPHLPSVLARLSEKEDCSSVLAVLTPLFANRRKFGWNSSSALLETVIQLATAVGDPVAWLQRQLVKTQKLPSGAKRQNLERGAAELILFGLIGNASARKLCNLYDEIQHNNITISPMALATTASTLAAMGVYDQAHEIYSTIDLTAAFDSKTAHTVFRMLHDLGLEDEAARMLASQTIDVDVELLLDTLSHCVKHGRQSSVLAILLQNVPRVADALAGRTRVSKLRKRDQQVLQRLFTSYTSIGDVAQGEVLLRIMEGHGFCRGTFSYNILLQAYVTRQDTVSAMALLEYMRERSVRFDRATYSTLMSLHVNQKNPSQVQAIFDEMQRDGIVPDSITYAILLNAQIEVNNWQKAAKLWESFPRDIQSDPNIANTLLKGMVLLSAPHQEVYRLFLSAYIEPSKADQIAWTILIQSACDSGHLSRARELFEDFKLFTRQSGSRLRLDHYLSSILVVGHIRHREIVLAKQIHDEMQREGVENTSVIYAAIIDASLKGLWPISAIRAKELAYKLLNESDALQREPHKRGPQPVENIIVPLMRSSIRDGDIRESERLFELAVEKGGQPSLTLYVMLLDAYRQTQEYDRVQEVWKAIRNMVIEPTTPKLNVVDFDKTLSLDSRLCIPLSIYIDAMSAANRLGQIQRVWADLHKQGFGFDAHNWNQLAVALVKAGHAFRGFDIVENVLIKHQEEVASRRFVAIRSTDCHSKSTPEGPVGGNSGSILSEHLLLEPFQRPPNRRHEFRDDTAAYQALRQERSTGVESASRPGGLDFDATIFGRYRPTDAIWRPFLYTVAVLEQVYSELEQGRSSMWALVAPEEEEGDMETPAEPHRDGSNPNIQRSSPAALLAKVNSKYTKTVSLIMLHRRQRKDRELMGRRKVRKRDT